MRLDVLLVLVNTLELSDKIHTAVQAGGQQVNLKISGKDMYKHMYRHVYSSQQVNPKGKVTTAAARHCLPLLLSPTDVTQRTPTTAWLL